MIALRISALFAVLSLAGCVSTEKIDRDLAEQGKRIEQLEKLTTHILANDKAALTALEKALRHIRATQEIPEGDE